jgi:hypothetical protein
MSQRFRSASSGGGSSSSSSSSDTGLTAADAAYCMLPAETRVVAALPGTEKLVQRLLARRHVEAEHLSQRVFVFDVSDSARTPLPQLYPLHTAATAFIEQHERRIQLIAQHTHAYRFLWRW